MIPLWLHLAALVATGISCFYTVRTWRSGEFGPAGTFAFNRDKDPLGFWATFGVQALAVLCMVLFMIYVTIERLLS